ncbi:MAG: hypothetical protein HQ568_04070 [Calditrichaeota bacterium]|nr:hypothetical protein [Calditrichota bacterium]
MGIINTLQKEKYINRLVRSFRIVYKCGDMAAIGCLRENYSKDELKKILDDLLDIEDEKLELVLFYNPPFKEKWEEVFIYDKALGHK